MKLIFTQATGDIGRLGYTIVAVPGHFHFLCSTKGEHVVAALSAGPSVRLSDRPSHFCPDHISKSIEGYLMKLDSLIEIHEAYCRIQKPCHHYLWSYFPFF